MQVRCCLVAKAWGRAHSLASLQALADTHNEVERLQHEDQDDTRTIDELGYQTVKCKAVCTSTSAVIGEETKRRRSLQQRAMDA